MLLTGRLLSAEQRLALALALALVLHAVVIFGIRFGALPTPAQAPVYSLSVALLEQREATPADLPGESLGLPSVLPGVITPHEVILPLPTPRTLSSLEEPLLATLMPAASHTSLPESKQRLRSPTAAVDLMTSALKIAGLESVSLPQASNSREKHIDPKSMTTIEGYYMESWRRRVEQIATLNFPETALHLNLTHGPTLDVAILADGSIDSIVLVHSSGHAALDDAARQIVELGAPYSPFPPELQRRYDILHIVRKWHFEQGRLLSR